MIRGELTNLRAVERTDSGALHRWFNDPDVMRYWGAPEAVFSLAEVQRRIEGWLDEERRLERPACLIIELLDGEPVGVVILSQFEHKHRALELSIMIGESNRWGQGLGTDALSALIDTCFDQWNLHRLWLRSEAFNERAHRLYERCGFVLDATLREASFLDGLYHDVRVYSLLETDRQSAAETPNE
jgi:RimJ/RimL family protein N-acetyltransferase